MKKLFFAATLFIASFVNAQAWRGAGDNKAQLGFHAYGGSGIGVVAAYDYGFHSLISVGIGGGVYANANSANENKTALGIYARGNVHLQDLIHLSKEWDVYPGISLGIINNFFDFGAHVGVRYFFTNSIGAYAEVGNRGSIGVTFNL